MAVVLVIGSRVLPALLGRIAHLGSRELFVVAVAVVAIGTAALAHEVGVSVALGAFVAGLALAESDLAASVLGEIVPLRELFATVFFVFIGLLLQPGVVLAGWPIVLTLLLLITLGKAHPDHRHRGRRRPPPADGACASAACSARAASSASCWPRWAWSWACWAPRPSARRWARWCSRSWRPDHWPPGPPGSATGSDHGRHHPNQSRR